MCIHEIDASRGSWQRTFHTRQHSYLVTQRPLRIVPAAASMYFFRRSEKTGADSTPGFVVVMEKEKRRLPPSAPPHRYPPIKQTHCA
eukprot:2823062-Rhodomonas_salina.1